jgi:hypothetical protein
MNYARRISGLSFGQIAQILSETERVTGEDRVCEPFSAPADCA